MSNKRKKAPPVKVDDEAKKRLNWNMHEDRRNELESLPTQSSDVTADCIPVPSEEPSCSKTFLSIVEEPELVLSKEGLVSLSYIPSASEETPDPCINYTPQIELGSEPSSSANSATSDSVVLPLIAVSDLDETWRVLIGEFNLRAQFPLVVDNSQQWTLQRTGGRLCLCASGTQEVGDCNMEVPSLECISPVGGSFGRVQLEELDWLQKRRIIELSVQLEENYVKVCVIIWAST